MPALAGLALMVALAVEALATGMVGTRVATETRAVAHLDSLSATRVAARRSSDTMLDPVLVQLTEARRTAAGTPIPTMPAPWSLARSASRLLLLGTLVYLLLRLFRGTDRERLIRRPGRPSSR